MEAIDSNQLPEFSSFSETEKENLKKTIEAKINRHSWNDDVIIIRFLDDDLIFAPENCYLEKKDNPIGVCREWEQYIFTEKEKNYYDTHVGEFSWAEIG